VKKQIDSGFSMPAGNDQGGYVETQTLNSPSNSEQLFATFFLGQLEFAIDVRHVQDAVELPPRIVPLPSSPDYLLGIINLRDNIIPIVDTRKRFRMDDKDASGQAYIAITRCKNRYMGLTFSRISEVIRVGRKRMETLAPEFQVEKDLVADVIKMGDGQRLIQVINPEAMFDFKELPESILAQMASRDEGVEAAQWRQALVFNTGHELFGVDAHQVREIIMVPEINQRVLVEDYIKGIIDIRGELISVIDLRTYLGEASTETGPDHRIIILRDDTMPMGVLVDGIKEVFRFDASALKPMPPLVKSLHSDGFRGVVEQDGASVVMLDMDALFQPAREQIEGHMRVHDDNAASQAAGGLGQASSVGKKNRRSPRTYISFELDTVYGAPIEHIREVVSITEDIHHLPGQVDFIQGFINLRAEVIPVVNLRKYFSIDDDGDGGEKLVMIFTAKNRQIGILIDRLLEIVTLDDENGKDVPQLLARRNAPRFRDMIGKIIETRNSNKEPVTTMIIDISRLVEAICPPSGLPAETEAVLENMAS
jgi:purine-binding chemotaxis protein CheW